MDWNTLYLYLRGFLEILYFISGVVLAGLGFFVFRQLKLAQESIETTKTNLQIASDALSTAKDDIQIRIQREAVILAAEQTEKFGKEVIPAFGKIIDGCKDKNLNLIEWKLENNLFDESTLKDINAVNAWLKKFNEAQMLPELATTLNDHEAFAIYFVGGAADERISYPSIAAVFCSHINRLSPLLVALRKKNNSKLITGRFQNTVTLFEKWSLRLKKESLDLQAARLTSESSEIHITEIPIIGSKKK